MRLRLSPFDIMLFVCVAVVTAVGGMLWTAWRESPASGLTAGLFSAGPSESRWGAGYMPNLPVIDQHGKTHRFYDDLIKDKRVIINFIFTSCSQICPLVTSRMALLQEKLGDAVGRDYFIYTLTVDPFNDGPEQMKRHASAFNVGPGWLFLTGKPEDIELINARLGERSKALNDHRQDILLGDDANGSWSKNSLFGELDNVVLTIHAMDPDSKRLHKAAAMSEAGGVQTIELVPGQALFSRMCSSCHTIGHGVRVGPDLSGVTERRDRAWLKSFIAKPERMHAQRDPVALELAARFPIVRMPNLGLSERDAEDVVSYLSSGTRR